MDGMYNQDNDRCAPQSMNCLSGTSWLSPAELDMQSRISLVVVDHRFKPGPTAWEYLLDQ